MTDFADPAAVFRAAVEALNAERWDEVAALCDPASLTGFKRQLVEQYAPSRPHATPTVDEYLRHSPDMPREVAEYHVAQHRKLAEPVHRLSREFPGVDSVQALRALSPAEVFMRWLEGRSPRRQLMRLVEQEKLPSDAAAQIAAQPFAAFHWEPVGAVLDGDRVAHVVYRHASHRFQDDGDVDDDDPGARQFREWQARMSPEERELARDLGERGTAMTATCRRQPDGSWRLIADYDFLHVGSIHIGPVVQDSSDQGGSTG